MISFLKNFLNTIIYFIILNVFNKSNYISSKTINLQPELLEKLYKICKQEDTIFCSMTESIKYSLNSIKTDLKSYPSNNCTDIFCLKYENVYTQDIECQDVEPKIENIQSTQTDGKFVISFIKCTFFTTGSLYLLEGNNINNSYNTFLSEIYFDKINFYQNKRSTKGELNITFEFDKTYNELFNYNKTDTIFNINDTNLITKMDNIMKEIVDNYINVLISIIEIDESTQITQIKYLNEIINKFAKGYSLLDSDIDDNENNITYIAYNDIRYNSFINIKNKLFIPNLFVSFEYALNYNITYNEGDLIFENISISKNNEDDYFGNITNINAEFNDLVCAEEKYSIWSTINNDFYNNFKKYK